MAQRLLPGRQLNRASALTLAALLAPLAPLAAAARGAGARGKAARVLLAAACIAGPGTVAGLTPAARLPSFPHVAPRAAITGTLTIVDHTSYSSSSTGASETDQTDCSLTLTFKSDGSATEQLTYTAHDMSDQTNNGYENKTTDDVTGSGSVSYDPGLNVSISQDGTFQLGASTASIQATETHTTEVTGQQPDTQTLTAQVGCSSGGHAPSLTGKVGSGPCLRATVTDNGHYGFTGNEERTSTTTMDCLAVPNLHPAAGRGTPLATPMTGNNTATAATGATATPEAGATATAMPGGTTIPFATATAAPSPSPTPECRTSQEAAPRVAASVSGAGAATSCTVRYALDWRMPDRYGHDWNHDGLIDYPVAHGDPHATSDFANPAIQIDPPDWPVDLLVSRGRGAPCDPAATYRWWVDNRPVTVAQRLVAGQRTCTFVYRFKVLRRYGVKVAVSGGRYHSGAAQRNVVVKDYLIVGLGDSVASGEGDPDRSLPTVQWQKAQCHRSAYSFESFAAAEIEKRDPHTSVTFVHLACSGASITEGLLDPFAGIEPDRGPKLPGQLAEMKRIIGKRHPDTLIISIGANDIDFGGIIATCAAQISSVPCRLRKDIAAEPVLEKAMPDRLKRLGDSYDTLAARLVKLGVPSRRMFLTEYFDPTHGFGGKICGQVLGMNAADLQWAYEHVQVPLNAQVQAAAKRHGWVYVGGIAADFRTHGYCTGPESWIVSTFAPGGTFWKEARQDGAFHPNEDGQVDIASKLVPLLWSRLQSSAS